MGQYFIKMPIKIEAANDVKEDTDVSFRPFAVFRGGYSYRSVLNFEHLQLTVELDQQILVSEKTLEGKVTIKPIVCLPNCPLIILISGCSTSVETPIKTLTMNDTEADLRLNQSSNENITEAVGDTQGQSDLSPEKDGSPERSQWLTSSSSNPSLPETFLEGDQTLFQLDEKTQVGKQTLDADTIYTYPIYFLLPSNLPQSISEVVMPNIEISIEYSLTLRMSIPEGEEINLKVPFYLKSPPKQYPYDCFTNLQKIRCYHPRGSQLDPLITKLANRVSKIICPSRIYDSCIRPRFKTMQRNYDTFHAEMFVVVNAGHNLYVHCRVYISPEAYSLSVQRFRSDHIAQNQTQTNHKRATIEAKYARLKLYGELAGHVTIIFEKTLQLEEGDYDMMEAETIINLDSSLRSYRNELFHLAYFFQLKIQFRSLHEDKIEDFLVTESKFELYL